MEYLERLHKRNILLTKLIWFSLGLGILVDIANKLPMKTIMTLVIAGVLVCGIITFIVKKKVLVRYIKYIIAIALGIFAYLLLSSSTGSTSFVNILIIYFGLAIISLYHDYKPIILSSLIGIFLTNYSFFQYRETLYAGVSQKTIISLNLYLVLISILLIAQSIIGQNMQKNLEKNQEDISKAKDDIEDIFSHIKETISTLSNFSSSLKDNVNVTGQISSDITSSFSEVAGTIDSETHSVSKISQSMSTIDQSINALAEVSSKMHQVSSGTAQATNDGNQQVKQLSSSMNSVVSFIENTVVLMEDLDNRTGLISEILATIDNIVKRTSLLALNAAIEAARAGEHGKGFAVVADEVRELASHSQEAIEEIGGILQEIQDKTKDVADEVKVGQKAVQKSTNVNKNVEKGFSNIYDNTMHVLFESEKLDNMVNEFQKSIISVTEEVQSIASSTEENAASVEEILASVEDQDRRISDIVSNFKQLDKLTNDLKELAGSR